jgi:hypothetical protein
VGADGIARRPRRVEIPSALFRTEVSVQEWFFGPTLSTISSTSGIQNYGNSCDWPVLQGLDVCFIQKKRGMIPENACNAERCYYASSATALLSWPTYRR